MIRVGYKLLAAWRSGSERRFYHDHDRKVNGSTLNLVSLLRSWTNDFLCLVESGEQQIKEVSEQNSTGKLETTGNS